VTSPGQRAFEAYAGQAGGKSLKTGEELPVWDMLPEDIQAAWEAAGAAQQPLLEYEGVRASRCQAGEQLHHHTALRFVWHHILPQVCGGKTEASNLAEVCDNCHYSVHILMYGMVHGAPPPKAATDAQYTLALQGFNLATAAGTQGKIPKEAAG
jgi:hypothetical protein